MDIITEFVDEPLGLFLILAILAIWSLYVPRILAPFLFERWQDIPTKYKSIIILMLPTIENALHDIWKRLGAGLATKAPATPTTIDDEMLKLIDAKITDLISRIDNATK